MIEPGRGQCLRIVQVQRLTEVAEGLFPAL